MRVFKGCRRSVLGGLALAAAFALLPASAASAATFPNACKNTASVNDSEINLEMTAAAPAMVFSGDPVTLSNIQQTLAVPGTIFVTGYNLGLLGAVDGPNIPTEKTIPATATTRIKATNTVEGTQTTNTASGSISTTSLTWTELRAPVMRRRPLARSASPTPIRPGPPPAERSSSVRRRWIRSAQQRAVRAGS